MYVACEMEFYHSVYSKMIIYSILVLVNLFTCVYNYIIIYTPFPYPKLCPYPKPTQQQTPVGTPKDPTNQIVARNLRTPIKPRPAGPHTNTKPKRG